MIVPKGKYDVIYADPPYQYEANTARPSETIEKQYPTMSLDKLKEMRPQIDEWAALNCRLYLWTPPPKVAEAIELMAAWGFKYRTCGVWDKLIIGLGYWFRQQHELLLVGIRGKPSPPVRRKRVSSIFRETRTLHSKKPQVVKQYLAWAYPKLRKLEMFARHPEEEWEVYGNESDGLSFKEYKQGQNLLFGNK